VVHGPQSALVEFEASSMRTETSSSLNLDTEIRFHLAKHVDKFVEHVLTGATSAAAAIATELVGQYSLRLTRDLGVARAYLADRYANNPDARFGLAASARDKDLVSFGVPNDFASTRIRYGPWYSEGEDGPFSCRHFREVVTEFGAQGLELDAVLLAWGTDLIRYNGEWSTRTARGYKKGSRVKDAHQLRLNAYRVLLTRGRDGTVVFVPSLPELEETTEYLKACGFKSLDGELA